MNQILFVNDDKSNRETIKDRKKVEKIKSVKSIKIFKLIFTSSIVIVFLSLLYYMYSYYISSKKEENSSYLLNTFNIERLYSNEDNYNIVHLNNNGSFFVVGSIEIPSIGINYPILSNVNDELLKVAPCKFFGPSPNQVGNLCIAAHNYDDNRFFSNLYKLKIGDKVNIYNSNNYLISYYIYDKYETNMNDTSCSSQKTYGRKEVTLVTCNNLNGNRLIIKAKE